MSPAASYTKDDLASFPLSLRGRFGHCSSATGCRGSSRLAGFPCCGSGDSTGAPCCKAGWRPSGDVRAPHASPPSRAALNRVPLILPAAPFCRDPRSLRPRAAVAAASDRDVCGANRRLPDDAWRGASRIADWRGATAADFGWRPRKLATDAKLAILALLAIVPPLLLLQRCLLSAVDRLGAMVAPDPVPLFFLAPVFGYLYQARPHRAVAASARGFQCDVDCVVFRRRDLTINHGPCQLAVCRFSRRLLR